MGCGKTTLGRAFARATGLQFIDLDHYIENRFHKTVRDIFADCGEEGFRDIERRMLDETSQFENVIIACGGGTPCFFDNMELMNKRGTTVLLNASEKALHRRLLKGRMARPLIANLADDELRDFISKALDSRMPYYSKAQIEFHSDFLESEEEICASVARLASLLNPQTSAQ